MDGIKKWFLSKGVIGSLVVLAMAALKLNGYDIPEGFKNDLLGNTEAVLLGAGGLLALWGRVSATKKIGK